MLDRVTGMQVFAKIAALGSLSAAARTLGMSQTMATKHMAALESRLGVKLLHRSTRRLTLTEAGRNYLEVTEKILAELEEADARIGADTFEVRGTLRLNVPVSYGIRAIGPLLPELACLHPQLTIELGVNDRYVDLIDEGWDLAIRIGRLENSSMVARRLATCPTAVCAAPGYLEARGTPRLVSDLRHHDCLGYTLSRSIGSNRWSFGAKGDVTVSVGGTLRANNGDVLVAAAIAGQGIIYQPMFLVGSAIAEGLLVPLVLDHPPTALDGIFAVYPADRRPPAKVRAVIDFLADRLGDEHQRRARTQ